MKSFKYKNYLLKSLISESTEPTKHNQIVYDFLTTMRYGNLPMKRGEHTIYIQQDETHTSFFVPKSEQKHIDQWDKELISKRFIYTVYTLSYDSQHTECRFDIEEQTFEADINNPDILNNFNDKIEYSDIQNYCSNLIKSLKLFKEPQTATIKHKNQIVDTDTEMEVLKQTYEKTALLQDVTIQTSDDTSGVAHPMFMKKKEIRFQPQDLIGDDSFRTLMATKQQAESTLLNWKKKQYDAEEETNVTVSCDILYQAFENSVSNKASDTIGLTKESLNSKYEIDLAKLDLHEIEKMIGVWPVEVLTPLVFLSMDKSIKWGKEGDYTSKQILNSIFGGDEVFKKGYIAFGGAGGELVDSEVAIPNNNGKFRKIGLSTKAGATSKGKGTAASLISIFKLLFNKEIFEYEKDGKVKERKHIFSKQLVNILSKSSDISTSLKEFIYENCSPLGIKMFEANPAEIGIIILFGGIKPAYHMSVLTKLCRQGKLFDLDITFEDVEQGNYIRGFCNYINSVLPLTDVIMEILNHQKYDFAQVNCLPMVNNNGCKYEWNVQYPAHFKGDVKLEPRGPGVAFHIHG